ncbi:MAG: hypothetical protein HYY17_12845 [Planctomycetes bacterium]|nr:hypothetical protein [Planctomycetota bacterium]
MSEHPAPERIFDLEHGIDLDGTVEAHLGECGDCARLAHRIAAERRRISAALEDVPPAGLAERILARSAPRRVPWGALANAAMFLICVATVAFGFRRPRGVEVIRTVLVRPPEEERVSAALDDLCRVEVERSVAEMITRAELSESREGVVRESLLAAASTTAEVFDRAQRGEIDMETLLATDTLAGIDARLRASLDGPEFERVSAYLDRISRDAAGRTTGGFVRDLAAAVDLPPAESAAIEKRLVERISWRRDVAFLPEFVRRHLCVHLLRSGGATEVARTDSLIAFLDREGREHQRIWGRLRNRREGP